MWIIPCLTDGLGNRLFQYAAAAGLAEKTKGSLVFLLPKCGKTGHGDFENIFKLFPKVPIEFTLQVGASYRYFDEKDGNAFTYEPFPNASVENILVRGCRQTELYFPASGILPDWSSLDKNLLTKYNIDTPEKQEKTWFLHVRLGDYRILPHHYLDLRSYYRSALSKIPIGSTIIWSSDEPEIYKEFLEGLAMQYGLHLVLNKENDELETLYILSHCKAGGVCSNSTFSWWAAYFSRSGSGSKSGIWYIPEKWGANLPPARDIYSSWMTKLAI